MIYLILTIGLSSLIYIIFKGFDTYKVNTFQAIVVNYLICAGMGAGFAAQQDRGWLSEIPTTTLPYALILGLLFITLFNLIGRTAQVFGVGIASLSDKLSLVVPVFIAFLFYGDQVTLLKVSGIVLAIVAVWLSVAQPKSTDKTTNKGPRWLPIAVFIGGGVISSLLKEVEFRFPGLEFNQFLAFLFATAAGIGIFVFLIQWIRGKMKPSPKSWLAGIALGIPNYGSIYYLFKTLDVDGWESSMIYPVNNIGIVLLTTILGFAFFRERTTSLKLVGLGLSILAIFLLIFEQVNVAI
ncbi:MAG: EamA family transporter [Saprospiraceae bacterium]|nr:EamA family transporter [Saprospiraceae bacterium]